MEVLKIIILVSKPPEHFLVDRTCHKKPLYPSDLPCFPWHHLVPSEKA